MLGQSHAGCGAGGQAEVEVNMGDVDGVGNPEDVHDGETLEAPEEPADDKRIIPTPIMPSPSEILQHRIDHIPYQSWCDHCVEGRGREMGHPRVPWSSDQYRRSHSIICL